MISRGKLKGQKRRMSPHPKRGYACQWCGSNDHYSFTCFQRPKKPIAVESASANTKRTKTRRAWFRANRPDNTGHWDCYLQIAPDCLRQVNTTTIDLEHVRSKARHPKLKYEPINIKPACQPCNKLKRSWSLEDLAETYPHIAKMIATPEWIAYENQLTELESRL